MLADAGHGRGRTVLVSGAPGVGKSALLGWADGRAEQLGWKVGTGVAAAVEGAWSYAPILDAVADLCRRHPTLLDGLDETVQQEIERALAGNALVWSGEDTHQRLFVATAELLRHAASGSGLMLILDDMHESDEVSLRLLHYLARCMSRERALVVVGHRDGDRRIQQVKASLSRRNLTFELPLAPLDREATAELIRSRYPGSGDELVERIWAVSGGLPFAAAEMLAAPASGTAAPLGAIGLGRLSTKARGALQRVAVIGTHFDTDQFIALTGIPERDAFAALDAALAAQVIVHTGAGYRFRHTLIRDALLDEIPTAERRAFHHQAADRLAAIGAPSTRIAHHLIAAGRLVEAVPRAISAAEAEAAVGAYSDALALVDAVRDQARGPDRTKVLALRANLLAALGDRTTIDAYRAAIAVGGESDRPLLRARMAAAAIKEADMDTAAAILDGLEPDGGPADASILLAKGSLAYLTGDIDEAARSADRAGRLAGPEENTWQRFDLVTLQAMIAHYRGEFFTRIRTELRRAQDDPVLASALFDPYLCVVEFLLYGTTPYREVVLLAESVRRTARRAGVLRAEAFATALLGEAALLSGDLAAAEHELGDAADLYREIAAPAGEASALQRLAEVRLFQGDRAEAGRLLSRALLRARWSMMALHLLQRIHGTMILAAPDPRLARTLVDRPKTRSAVRTPVSSATSCSPFRRRSLAPTWAISRTPSDTLPRPTGHCDCGKARRGRVRSWKRVPMSRGRSVSLPRRPDTSMGRPICSSRPASRSTPNVAGRRLSPGRPASLRALSTPHRVDLVARWAQPWRWAICTITSWNRGNSSNWGTWPESANVIHSLCGAASRSNHCLVGTDRAASSCAP